jgi:N-acetylornithine carbamoyltransferase
MVAGSDLLESRRVLSGFRGRSLLSTADFSRQELAELLDLAVHHKTGLRFPGSLKGKAVALLFFNPSLRTRTSMAVVVQELGGTPVVMDVGRDAWGIEFLDGVVMDGENAEHIKEVGPVLSGYVDAVGVRCYPSMKDYRKDREEIVLSAFERYCSVPIINLESSTQHPLQSLGDVMTIQEKFKTLEGRRVTLAWAYHPKLLPMSVPNSFALIAAQFGMNLTVACPPEYELDPEFMSGVKGCADENGGGVEISHDLNEACDGAEVVYAKSWAGHQFYGRSDQDYAVREKYKDWMITSDLMRRTSYGFFMHPLPVRRNVVVSDEVLDGSRSIVFDQAENRLHVQKTLLSLLLRS